MKVRFRDSCAGIRFAFAANNVYDLDDEFAMGFVKAGLAVPLEGEVVAAVEPMAERVATLPSVKRKRF